MDRNRYNEQLRLSERRLDFDVSQLKRTVAAAVDRCESDIERLLKLAQGGFNRTFEITMRDGLQVIARLPYPSTLPKRYAVASEVATIDLVRSYGVPAPKIYAYSVTAGNPIGAEYIIMEKMRGSGVGHRWFDLSLNDRKTITLDVAKIEAVLFSIPLPASGSVYYKKDLGAADRFVELPDRKDLCIGPEATFSWWFGRRDSMAIDRGPFVQANEVMAAGARKELEWIKLFGRPRFPFDRHHREHLAYKKSQPEEHIKSLETYLKACSYLVPESEKLTRPTIRHPDLQPHNILVSADCKITGLIDWQHCPVRPRFLQAGIPKYWQNTTEGPTVLEKPVLPANFDQLSESEQAKKMRILRQRQVHMLYLAGTNRFHSSHMDAYLTPGLAFKKRIFEHASASSEGNNIFLKADLVLAMRNWADLTMTPNGTIPPYPISFSEAEAENCLQIHSRLAGVDAEMAGVREGLGIGSDGWVPNEDYETAVERNAHIKRRIKDGEDTPQEKEPTLRHYPFDDHDENE